jgi:hypothetical protein
LYGSLAEWFKAAVLKTSAKSMEGCPSGLRNRS